MISSAPNQKVTSPKLGIHRLVWYEEFGEISDAIQRKKTMKHWSRQWKINVIERDNPHWEDLYPRLFAVEQKPLTPFVCPTNPLF